MSSTARLPDFNWIGDGWKVKVIVKCEGALSSSGDMRPAAAKSSRADYATEHLQPSCSNGLYGPGKLLLQGQRRAGAEQAGSAWSTPCRTESIAAVLWRASPAKPGTLCFCGPTLGSVAWPVFAPKQSNPGLIRECRPNAGDRV